MKSVNMGLSLCCAVCVTLGKSPKVSESQFHYLWRASEKFRLEWDISQSRHSSLFSFRCGLSGCQEVLSLCGRDLTNEHRSQGTERMRLLSLRSKLFFFTLLARKGTSTSFNTRETQNVYSFTSL